ncbi:Zinc finger protein 398 [Frankliniella fusca]|uniref:Zinc finger protein 398 n=1 Tax=Frankliniella fusca TaxID=407009 RepID=A0AAE1HSU8_9NEOP|nr:Zinc finger protein 398 [Frankliniella fusca]
MEVIRTDDDGTVQGNASSSENHIIIETVELKTLIQDDEETTLEVVTVVDDGTASLSELSRRSGQRVPKLPAEAVSHSLKDLVALKLLGYKCDICDAEFTSKQNILRHCDAHGNLEAFSAVLGPSEDLAEEYAKPLKKPRIIKIPPKQSAFKPKKLSEQLAILKSKAEETANESFVDSKEGESTDSKENLGASISNIKVELPNESREGEGTAKRRRKLYCNICKVDYPSGEALYHHFKDDHDIDNPYLRGNIALSTEPRSYDCKDCSASFTTSSALCRHRKKTHLSHGPVTGICHHCGNSFRLSTLPCHEKICGSRRWPRRRQDCSYEDCKASYFKKEELIKHMKEEHKVPLEPMRTLRFENKDEFFKWKEEEEDRTFSFYTKHAGTKRNIMTYYCQHEGSERSHKGGRKEADNAEKLKKMNKKGRIKTGNVCTSYLRAKITATEIIAYYYPTHSHPISPEDVKHQPLSKEIIQFIKEQIALNVPARQIQTMVKKRLSETRSCRRDAQISLKRINSFAQRYNRLNDKAPNVAVDSFNSFIDALCSQDDSPVLFYQPPSDNARLDVPNEEDHLFFLGLQTADQQRMLQRETAMPMFISYTKSDYTLQYYLISVLVTCEKNFEYPVGHLISSQLNEDVVSLFLQNIGERCPDLNVNCIISCDCPEINGAIRKVFGADGPYFLSKWHFLEYMRKDFFKSVPSNKVEELFDFVLAMSDAESEDRFLFLYNSFKEQFELAFPDVISNFGEYFVRAATWASCYRQEQGIIDSCLYADSFFNKYNKKYRRRPLKSINLLPDLLLYLQECYRDSRDKKENAPDHADFMKDQHNMGIEIPSDLIQETLSRHWTVQASKHGQTFTVMQCLSKCFDSNCSLRCNDCVNLCSHMYFCTCGKTEYICLHIHKVFQLHGPMQTEMEEGCDESSSYFMEHDETTEHNEIEEQGTTREHDEGMEYEEAMEQDVKPEAIVITVTPPENPEKTDELIEAEAKRENTLKNLDLLRQIVDQRCLPEEIVHVINATVESLCNLIDSS